MVNLANFRSNCFIPAFWNSTVAFVFSPVILSSIPFLFQNADARFYSPR